MPETYAAPKKNTGAADYGQAGAAFRRQRIELAQRLLT